MLFESSLSTHCILALIIILKDPSDSLGLVGVWISRLLWNFTASAKVVFLLRHAYTNSFVYASSNSRNNIPSPALHVHAQLCMCLH